MNVQRAELLERLSTAHNFCNLDDEDNYIAASKAVRQVRKEVSKIKSLLFSHSLIVLLFGWTAGHPSAEAVGHRVAGCATSQHLLWSHGEPPENSHHRDHCQNHDAGGLSCLCICLRLCLHLTLAYKGSWALILSLIFIQHNTTWLLAVVSQCYL